jgi:hypothetical protein
MDEHQIQVKGTQSELLRLPHLDKPRNSVNKTGYSTGKEIGFSCKCSYFILVL